MIKRRAAAAGLPPSTCGARTCSGSPGRPCRRYGGTAGVDGETVADIESEGVDRWLGALARDLKPEQYAYRPGRGAHDAVRRVRRVDVAGVVLP